MNAFADWLIKEREARGWDRADLARYVRCNVSVVGRWENGETFPHLPRFAALMRVLSSDANTVLRLVPLADSEDNASAA